MKYNENKKPAFFFFLLETAMQIMCYSQISLRATKAKFLRHRVSDGGDFNGAFLVSAIW